MLHYCTSCSVLWIFYTSAIIRLSGACIFNTIGSCQKPLLYDCRKLYSYQHYMRIPISTSCQHLVLSEILILSVLFIVLICTFLVTSVIEHHFVCLFSMDKWHLPVHIICPFFLGLCSLKFSGALVNYVHCKYLLWVCYWSFHFVCISFCSI